MKKFFRKVALNASKYNSILEEKLSPQEKEVLISVARGKRIADVTHVMNDSKIGQRSHTHTVLGRLTKKGFLKKVGKSTYKIIDHDLYAHIIVRCLKIKEYYHFDRSLIPGSALIKNAFLFAVEFHGDQIRNNKAKEPYVHHLEEVADLVEKAGGTDKEIAAAWLHDSIEDTRATLDYIVRYFGQSIGDCVLGLTDPPEFSELEFCFERKKAQAERIKTKSLSVKVVKIADQTSNLRCVVIDPPVSWDKKKCIDYIKGARLIVNECSNVSKYLEQEFEKAYKDAYKKYGITKEEENEKYKTIST